MGEINAQIAVGGGNAGAGPASASGPSGADGKKFDNWISFHEPKINLMQRNIEDMKEELHEKVSFTMVQSMIAGNAEGTRSSNPDRQG